MKVVAEIEFVNDDYDCEYNIEYDMAKQYIEELEEALVDKNDILTAWFGTDCKIRIKEVDVGEGTNYNLISKNIEF